MGKVIRIGGGSTIGWDGEVLLRGDLPITLGDPVVGSIYLVQNPTTILLGIYTTYQSGLYIRDFNNGNLNDWRRLNVKVKFTSSEFAIVDTVDQSKQSKYDVSLITTGTTRTITTQDADGTMAFLADIAAHDLAAVLTSGNKMNDGQTIEALNGVAVFDPRFLGVNNQMSLYTGIHAALGIGTESFIDFLVANLGLGHGKAFMTMSDAGPTQSIFIGSSYDFLVDNCGKLSLSNSTAVLELIKGGFAKVGSITIPDNDAGDHVSLNLPNFPSNQNSQNSTLKMGVINSVINGGITIIAKTNNTSYANQIAYNKLNEAFQLIVKHITPTADRVQDHQDANGIIALVADKGLEQFILDPRGVVGNGGGWADNGFITDTPVLLFDDAFVEKSIYMYYGNARALFTTIDPVVRFTVYSTVLPVVAAEDVRWQLTARYIAIGESPTKAVDETLLFTQSLTIVANERQANLDFTLDRTKIAIGDVIQLTLTRIGNDAADTYTNDVAVGQSLIILQTTKHNP